jgi:hypothetical protein
MHIRQATQEDAEEISKIISSVAHFFTVEPDGRGAEQFMLSITPGAIRNNICDPCFQYIRTYAKETFKLD